MNCFNIISRLYLYEKKNFSTNSEQTFTQNCLLFTDSQYNNDNNDDNNINNNV